MNKKIIKSLLVSIFVFAATTVYAQGPSGFDEDVTDVPLDGGIVTITLMAAAYGAKRYKKNKDNKSL